MILEWLPEAREGLRALPKDIARRIAAKMDWFVAQDDPLHFAKPLKNWESASHRFRIGDYRVLCRVQRGLITILLVLSVKDRKDAY